MYVGMCMLVQILKRPEEGRRYPETGVTSNCEPTDLVSGNKLRSCAGAVDALESTSLATTTKGFLSRNFENHLPFFYCLNSDA